MGAGLLSGLGQAISQTGNVWISSAMDRIKQERQTEYQQLLQQQEREYTESKTPANVGYETDESGNKVKISRNAQGEVLAQEEILPEGAASTVGKMIEDYNRMPDDNPMKETMLKRIQAEIETGGVGQMSLSPMLARGPDGQIQAFQLSSQGGSAQVQLPDGFTLVDPYTKAFDSTLGKQNAMQQTVAGVEQEKARGKFTGENIASAPQDIQQADQMISLIDKAIEHPGRESATGMSSLLNPVAAPGSERKDFLVLADQLRGNTFLQAYQSLKGGGQITEIEGTKAEQAQARLNEAQSEQEYVNALNDMKFLIQLRKEKSQSLLNSQQQPQNMGFQPSVSPSSDTMIKNAPITALRALYANPDKIEDFVAKFGYKPEGF